MELKGQGFTLRDWRTDDAVPLQHHADNYNVASRLVDSFPYPYTLTEAHRWVAAWQHQTPQTNFVIAVDDQLAGVIGLELQRDIHRKTLIVGYWLGEDYWGRGIMTQAVRLITRYAFDELGAICVQVRIMQNNPASMRVVEKAGFIRQGVFQQSLIKNGEVLDEHLFAAFPATY